MYMSKAQSITDQNYATEGSHTGPSGVKNNSATFVNVFLYVRNEKIFTKKLRDSNDSIVNSGNFDKFQNK